MTFTRTEWNTKVRVNFARFLPSLFKGISIIPEKNEERLPEGFKRVYPMSGNIKGDNKAIRYL